MLFSWVDHCLAPYFLLFHLLFGIISCQNHQEPPAHADPHEKHNLTASGSQVSKGQDVPMAAVTEKWDSHFGICRILPWLYERIPIPQSASLSNSSPKAFPSQQQQQKTFALTLFIKQKTRINPKYPWIRDWLNNEELCSYRKRWRLSIYCCNLQDIQ